MRLSKDELTILFSKLDLRDAGRLSLTCRFLKDTDPHCVWMRRREWDMYFLVTDAFMEGMKSFSETSDSFQLLLRIAQVRKPNSFCDPTLFVFMCALGRVDILRALIQAFPNEALESHLYSDPWMERLLSTLALVPAKLVDALYHRLTALEAAARYGRVECMSALLEENARVTKSDSDERSDDGASSTNISTELIESAYCHAVRHGHAPCLRLLVQSRSWQAALDINKVGALSCAARDGHVECVMALLEATADVNAAHVNGFGLGASPLELASSEGHVSCMKLLIEAGAHINIGARGKLGGSPLGAARDGEVARFLIRANAQVNSTDLHLPPLHEASCHSVSAVRVLLAAGAHVNATGCGEDGFTPLMYAARHGQDEAVLALLQGGADANLTSAGGMLATALVCQCDGQYIDYTQDQDACARCVRHLVDFNADPNLKVDLRGTTPLMEAARYGASKLLHILLKAGADVNAMNAEGLSAVSMCFGALLDSAVPMNDQVGCLGLLIDYQADVNAAARDGRVPLAILRGIAGSNQEKEKMAQMLVQAGAAAPATRPMS